MNKTTATQQSKTASFLPPVQNILQRKCACGNHTIAGGECAECAKKTVLQRKLTIGASNDPLEQEADRVADQVMAAAANSSVSRAPLRLQRYAGQTSLGNDTVPDSVDRVLAGSGRPLEPVLREDMEQRFGHDFSQVRVHSGGGAEQSARDVNARAYAAGNNIVFGEGSFSPATQQGLRLIAHELTHVVQQSGISGTQIRRVPAPPKPLPPAEVAAIKARLEAIIRSGGDVPKETRVIGAAIIHVEGEGYKGSLERRAISSKGTDDVGKGAAVPHDVSPDNRSFSATRSIAGSGARKEFPFSHVNDAEMKLFEGITKDLAPNAKGTIHFMTMRVRQVNGQTVFEPYPACSGCTRASFELAGAHPNMSVASHAPVHKAAALNLVEAPASAKPALPEGKPASNAAPAKATPQDASNVAPKQSVVAQAPAPLKPAGPPDAPAAKAPSLTGIANNKPPAAKVGSPVPIAAKPPASSNSGATTGGGRQRFTAPVGAFSRPGNFADDANAKAQAKGGGAILVVQGVLAILTYFADKYQRERADTAWAEAYPRIQEEVTRTGRGVVVYVEYTQNTGSSVLIFEGIHWSSGGHDGGQPGSLRAPGQTASFSRSYVGPTEAQASIADDTALIFRRDEARTKQRELQGMAELMAKEGWLGRKLRERAGDNISPIRVYDAKAHIVSASQSIKDKRYSDAVASLDKADAAMDEMWVQIKTYVGEKKLKELSGEN